MERQPYSLALTRVLFGGGEVHLRFRCSAKLEVNGIDIFTLSQSSEHKVLGYLVSQVYPGKTCVPDTNYTDDGPTDYVWFILEIPPSDQEFEWEDRILQQFEEALTTYKKSLQDKIPTEKDKLKSQWKGMNLENRLAYLFKEVGIESKKLDELLALSVNLELPLESTFYF